MNGFSLGKVRLCVGTCKCGKIEFGLLLVFAEDASLSVMKRFNAVMFVKEGG